MVGNSGRNPQSLDLADRKDQLAQLSRFLWGQQSRSSRCLLIEASQASGVTHFLRYAAQVSDSRAICVYADLERESLGDIVDRYLGRRAKSWRGRLCEITKLSSLWNIAFKVLASVSLPINWFRPMAVGFGELGNGLFFSPYGSQHIEKFAKSYSCPLSRERTIFFIDNAQASYNKVMDLLRATFAPEYSQVYFILTHVRRIHETTPFREFCERVQSTSGHQISVMKFPLPDEELLCAYTDIIGVPIEHEERQAILKECGHNIHRITSRITHPLKNADELTPIEAYILRLLSIAGQPLRLSDVRMICFSSPLVVVPENANWESLLESLRCQQLVQTFQSDDADTLIALSGRSVVNSTAESADGAQRMAIANELYDYFSEAAKHSVRHSLSSTSKLLYRLARDVAPEHLPQHAQTLVDVAMRYGSLDEAQQYIDEAVGGNQNVHACFVQVAFYVSTQDYAKAIEVLERLTKPVWSRHRILRVIHAISLNRVREHGGAASEISELMAENCSVDELAVLASYKIAGLLHEGRYAEARHLQKQFAPQVTAASCYGYFLRTTAAVYMWGEGRDLSRASETLRAARHWFEKRPDSFGALTTLCNLAVVSAYEGDIIGALGMFQESYKGLRVFGLHNIEEVSVNLGTALLWMGRFEDARGHLARLLPSFAHDFPRAIGEISLALADLYAGDHATALRRVKELQSWVRTVGLSEPIDLANRALEFISSCTRSGSVPNSFPKDLPLEWCQYWSQNPLAMIPNSQLTA